MSSSVETKVCLYCGKPLKGRVDKKFCDDSCRNNFNNQQKAKGSHSNYVRNITNALLKNRKILESFLSNDKKTVNVKREKLLEQGFHFKYITHIYTTKDEKTYFFCYDYGYLPLDNDWFLIVKKQEQ